MEECCFVALTQTVFSADVLVAFFIRRGISVSAIAMCRLLPQYTCCKFRLQVTLLDDQHGSREQQFAALVQPIELAPHQRPSQYNTVSCVRVHVRTEILFLDVIAIKIHW